ncbi:MAG: hypothetical protein IJQ82_11210, partial [Selenomonadaceae bacterium]|nr:hypothetical protein [Selenomonadaceae bacterium]
ELTNSKYITEPPLAKSSATSKKNLSIHAGCQDKTNSNIASLENQKNRQASLPAVIFKLVNFEVVLAD